jgi:hypothetical protein
MITKQQLSELEGVIRDLVPELMKLSFGCRFKRTADSMECVLYEESDGIWLEFYSHPNLRSPAKINIKDEAIILGHPITLEHCRVALRRLGNVDLSLDWSVIASWDREVCERWQDLEPWEKQKQAHEFLYQYLVTKNK